MASSSAGSSGGGSYLFEFCGLCLQKFGTPDEAQLSKTSLLAERTHFAAGQLTFAMQLQHNTITQCNLGGNYPMGTACVFVNVSESVSPYH